MSFYVYWLLLLLNSHGTMVVGEFGGPAPNDTNAREVGRVICQGTAKDLNQSLAVTQGADGLAYACVQATPENWQRYFGKPKGESL